MQTLVPSLLQKWNLVTGKKATFSNLKNATIRFEQVQDNALGKEGYHLNVNEKGIQIKANTNAGLFYAWQSLLQIMPTAIYNKTIQNNVKWETVKRKLKIWKVMVPDLMVKY